MGYTTFVSKSASDEGKANETQRKPYFGKSLLSGTLHMVFRERASGVNRPHNPVGQSIQYVDAIAIHCCSPIISPLMLVAER